MTLNLTKSTTNATPITAAEHDQNFTDIETDVNGLLTDIETRATAQSVSDLSTATMDTIGNLTAADVGAATAAQGALADTAVQPDGLAANTARITALEDLDILTRLNALEANAPPPLQQLAIVSVVQPVARGLIDYSYTLSGAGSVAVSHVIYEGSEAKPTAAQMAGGGAYTLVGTTNLSPTSGDIDLSVADGLLGSFKIASLVDGGGDADVQESAAFSIDTTIEVTGGPTYGDPVGIHMSLTKVIDGTVTYMGQTNWQNRSVANPVDSNGVASGITFNATGLSATERPTLMTDTGNVHFDLFDRAIEPNNIANGAELFNLANIPFPKYDVKVAFADTDRFTPDATRVTLYDAAGRKQYYAKHDRPDQDINDPREFFEFVTFEGLTGSTFSITKSAGNLRSDLHGVVGVQIIPRTDSLAAIPTDYAQDLIVNGDSYSQAFEIALNIGNQANTSRTRRFWGFAPQATLTGGVGGSTYDQQIIAIEARDFTAPSVLLWYEGLAESVIDVATARDYINRMRTAKGDEKWAFVLPIPAPSVGPDYTAYLSGTDAVAAALMADYGPDHIIDCKPFLNSLDPDTSVGGLPASIYQDQFHLTAEIEQRVAWEVIGPKMRRLFEL